MAAGGGRPQLSTCSSPGCCDSFAQFQNACLCLRAIPSMPLLFSSLRNRHRKKKRVGEGDGRSGSHECDGLMFQNSVSLSMGCFAKVSAHAEKQNKALSSVNLCVCRPVDSPAKHVFVCFCWCVLMK